MRAEFPYSSTTSSILHVKNPKKIHMFYELIFGVFYETIISTMKRSEVNSLA